MTYHPTMWERIQKARLNVESDNLVPRFLYIKNFREKKFKIKIIRIGGGYSGF